MSVKTGIWIDKKQAYIVTLSNGNHKLEIIESDADFRVRFEGEKSTSSKFGNQSVNHKKEQAVHLEKQLKYYYTKIIKKISSSEKIYIFGPAEAKSDFNKQLSIDQTMVSKITAVETSHKLTENQIIAAVKKHFDS